MIAVLTVPGDSHALAICWALDVAKVPFRLIFLSDYPDMATVSIHLDGLGDYRATLKSEHGEDISGSEVKVVWHRRVVAPSLSEAARTELAPADHQAAGLLLASHAREFHAAFAPHAAWVNPLEGRMAAEARMNQLRAAARSGLKTPPTLISNNVDDIHSFSRVHGWSVVAKSLRQLYWHSHLKNYTLPTSLIIESDLQYEQGVRYSPLIYQPLIEKDHELRVLVMECQCLAVRIDSQEAEETRIDWRQDARRVGTPIYRTELPDAISNACVKIVKDLGLRTASLDLIVRPDSAVVFLEANEMGQFLWMEEAAPDLPVLWAFTRYLCGLAGVNFTLRPEEVTLAAARADGAFERGCKDMAEHAKVASPLFIYEAEDGRVGRPAVP